jgi:hypothetical protein
MNQTIEVRVSGGWFWLLLALAFSLGFLLGRIGGV